MKEQEPSQKYDFRRRQLVHDLKSKNYWPEGMKHPADYRGFYWTDDLTFCGFATLSHQERTIGMIKKAIDTQKPRTQKSTKRSGRQYSNIQQRTKV